MAAITISAAGASLLANAAAVGAASTPLTTANVVAIANMLIAMGDRKGLSYPLTQILTPTDQAQLIP